MTKLLEMKDKLIKFYSMYEVYAKPVIKFVGYMIMYIMISSNIGYNAKVSSIAVTLVLSLIGCLLPVGFTVFFASIVILLDICTCTAYKQFRQYLVMNFLREIFQSNTISLLLGITRWMFMNNLVISITSLREEVFQIMTFYS